MGIKLSSPCVLASLTLMSNTEISRQIEYYLKVVEMGAGAIVLPSVNPSLKFNKNTKVLASCVPITTGLSSRAKMAFSVLGPTTNLPSVEYNKILAENLCTQCPNTPIIASVANIGTENEILEAIKILSSTGVKGLELNFSCPNVVTHNKDETGLTIDLLRKIRSSTNLPISLKLTPYNNYNHLLSLLDDEIDGLTLSNAYIGLIPPNINDDSYTPFSGLKKWSPSGVYGPFEKLLTYYNIYNIQKFAATKKLSIACVGGLVNSQDIIQALLLGADIVELSSVIAWEGISIFTKFNDEILEYLNHTGVATIDDLKGRALPAIVDSANTAYLYSSQHTMKVDEHLCKKCNSCICCDKMCIAISQDFNKKVHIDQNLCSGCGWCYHTCINNAISVDNKTDKIFRI